MNPRQRKFTARVVSAFTILALLAGPAAVSSVLAAAGDLTRVSVDSGGVQGNGGSYAGQLSADGRYVAFASGASNLVIGDTNNVEDVFVKDRITGVTARVSLATGTGAQANGDSGGTVAISSDGRFVAFESSATNLVAVDTNGLSDIFVRDLQTGVTTLVSVDSSGIQANDSSERASISGDGRYISFLSSATNLVANDTNGVDDIFVYDRQTGVTVCASVDSSGVGSNSSTWGGSISADGKYVVFASRGSNLVSGDTNDATDVFVHAIQTGQTTRDSVNSNGEQADQGASEPSISGDGRFISFSSYSNNLMSEDTYDLEYVYIRDRQTGITSLASEQNGYPMIGWADSPVMSVDGRYVAFGYDDKGDGDGIYWVYVHDRITNETVLPTAGGRGDNGTAPSYPSLSGNGQYLAFTSGSGSLVMDDTNAVRDVFITQVSYPPDLLPTVVSVFNECSNGCGGPADAVVDFSVRFSEMVTGVDASDFALVVNGSISGAAITNVRGARNEYVVTVNTGLGDGSLRLDIIDDDSIKDFSLNPLGGVGVGNGNFTTGDAYAVHKSIPMVASIVRTDPDPVFSDAVHFMVSFNEEVSGVDASDFTFSTIGSISGVSVADISGAGASYTVTVNTGMGDGSLRMDLIDNDSIVDAFANPLGGIGSNNGNFTAGEAYTIDKNAPLVISDLCIDPNPTNAANIRFIITFSEMVSGFDGSDLILTTTGDIADAKLVEISHVDAIYTITVDTGSGSGSLRLDVVDDDSVVDSGNHPLGGPGIGNGNFTVGAVYTINKFTVIPVTTTLRSTGSNDGWVLESAEDTNLGGSKNSAANLFKLGDDAQDRQFRSILHFPTYYLPDQAVITQVILMIEKQDVIGTDPFTTHQNISIDIRRGRFSNFNLFNFGSLQLTDFQAPADAYSVGTIQNNPVSGWYWAMLDARAFPYINLVDVTQLRLGFQFDDNDDLSEDSMRFYSGDYPNQKDRPHLLIKYYTTR